MAGHSFLIRFDCQGEVNEIKTRKVKEAAAFCFNSVDELRKKYVSMLFMYNDSVP